ncbi:MAG: 4Fe-4S binding protein [Spirochaetaceae bacterium]|jgi:NAD-dependent dihydropyrimidine dehydrogenase PreA subunit|nr:4Fe-4S binding protein [Spirochaetaceae bacterium]
MNVIYVIVGVIILFWIFGGIYRHLRGRNKILHIIEENCTGCKRCLKMCKHKALNIINDENETHIVVNTDRCTSCGDCISVCKFNALELVGKI